MGALCAPQSVKRVSGLAEAARKANRVRAKPIGCAQSQSGARKANRVRAKRALVFLCANVCPFCKTTGILEPEPLLNLT